MLLDDLFQVIETLRERITVHGVQLRQSEALTRSTLVDPLLRVLGWDTESPTLVIPEYKVSKVDGGDGKADYALLNEGNPAIVIEAKRLGAPLSDAANQCFQYCSKDGILYFAVTDGCIWDVYETNRPVAFAEKKIVSFNITDYPGDVCLDTLVLWRRSIQSGAVRKAQTPIIEPQRESPLPIDPPEPTTAPVKVAPMETTSPAQEGNWQTLAQLKPVKGDKPPPQIRFPDGSITQIKHWAEIPQSTVDWLNRQGKLNETCIPIQSGKRYILSGSPIHPNGADFKAARKSGQFYLEGNYSSFYQVKNATTIIEKAGIEVTAEQFSVRLS